ncbi:MAG: GNAT family N-acetyltransferase [Vicinamibacterales bacterium]
MSAPDQPVINITGERVALGPPSRAQLAAYARWFSDMNTMRTQGDPQPAPRTTAELATWYDVEMSLKPDRHFFSVYDRANWQHIGFVDLHHIDRANGTATMSLMVGEPAYRGQGYGTEMVRLILNYGFATLGLHNIMLECYEYNLARRAYEKAGFREFARWKEAHRMGRRAWDIIFMDCVASDFLSRESP